MGAPQPAGSERPDAIGAGVHREFCPGARGECLEDAGSGTFLHLGSGHKKWDAWINVDMVDTADVQSDLRALPYADNYADRAAAIHVIEHFYLWDVPSILREW